MGRAEMKVVVMAILILAIARTPVNGDVWAFSP